jgi:Uma2 family endonuclease
MPMTPVLDRVESDQPRPANQEIHYPERDGKPLGETDWHITAILYLLGALRYVFRQSEDVYVAADMLFYYEEGNPNVFKVPDVYVVRGVSRTPRRVYKLWEEKVAPCAIFEVTSRGTRWEDVAEKKGLYEFLGVREYFLFDPLAEYLKPQLQGYRLNAGRYEPIAPLRDGSLISQELGVTLRPEGTYLRIVDPSSQKVVPSFEEAAVEIDSARLQAQIQTQRAEVEARRAQAEAQRAEVEARRAQAEARRAQTEAQRAEVEAQRAQTEAQRADTAEAELARLRAELQRLRDNERSE